MSEYHSYKKDCTEAFKEIRERMNKPMHDVGIQTKMKLVSAKELQPVKT